MKETFTTADIKKMISDSAFQETLDSSSIGWNECDQDEDDIYDYLPGLQKYVTKFLDIEIVKMTSYPFGFIAQGDFLAHLKSGGTRVIPDVRLSVTYTEDDEARGVINWKIEL